MNCPYCDTHIDEHKASRCLDAWVAEAVMGYTDIRQDKNWEYCLFEGDCHEDYGVACFYSTQISAAWEVVEKLQRSGHCVEIGYDMIAWSVCFMHIDGDEKYKADWRNSIETQICLAAIKAVAEYEGVKVSLDAIQTE